MLPEWASYDNIAPSMALELQEYFGIDYRHAELALQGIANAATILENLKQQGILDYTTISRSLVVGPGNAQEMWLLQRLGVPDVLGVDNDTMPSWGIVRNYILARTPDANITTDTFAHWVDTYDGDQFDLMLTLFASPLLWNGVNWEKVANLLTPGGVFVIDSDVDPDGFGFTDRFSLDWFRLNYDINLSPEVSELTSGTTTIYEARDHINQRRVQLARHR